MGNIRNCNSDEGSFTFIDGILRSGKKSKDLDAIIDDFMMKSKTEDRYILSFNRESTIYFKAIKRSELKKHFLEVMYFNGSSRGCEFGFRFLKRNEHFLLSLADVYNEAGEKMEMSEDDFSEIVMECRKLDPKANLGNVAEYVLSNNVKDITDRFRQKKHDVYIYVMLDGKLCKAKKASEVKASYSGQKNRPLYEVCNHSTGYKKSNGSVKYNTNLELRSR